MALFSRIFEYLDLVPDVQAPAQPVTVDQSHVRGEVRFEGVEFAYADGAPVLRDLDLTIPAGHQRVGQRHRG